MNLKTTNEQNFTIYNTVKMIFILYKKYILKTVMLKKLKLKGSMKTYKIF